jgi:sugar phosphate isomerase/epimerase
MGSSTRLSDMASLHPLSLEHITAWEASPPELVDIAADLGCVAISLFVQGTDERVVAPPLINDTALRRETAARLNDRGVALATIECFVLAPDTRVGDYRAALETGASLGARNATTIVFDPEPARVLDNFGRLAEIAAELALNLNLEFLAFSAIPNLAAAARLVRASGQANAGIVLDSLHLTRSGGVAADLHGADASLIRAAQICDGPASMPLELQMFHEGFEQRMLPGSGSFDLAGFLRGLPAGLPLGVEVPLKDLREQGIPARERARRAVEATRHLLQNTPIQ